jgi:hypothetical protein
MTGAKNSFHHAVGPGTVSACHGIYLGRVSKTRKHDVWVKVRVPQVLGDAESDWARPNGFDSIGVSAADLPWEANDGDHTHTDPQGGTVGPPNPLDEQHSFHKTEQVLYQDGTWHTNILPSYTGEKNPIPTGPGPGVGTLVLVQFLGGDKRMPVYSLTTQNVS